MQPKISKKKMHPLLRILRFLFLFAVVVTLLIVGFVIYVIKTAFSFEDLASVLDDKPANFAAFAESYKSHGGPDISSDPEGYMEQVDYSRRVGTESENNVDWLRPEFGYKDVRYSYNLFVIRPFAFNAPPPARFYFDEELNTLGWRLNRPQIEEIRLSRE